MWKGLLLLVVLSNLVLSMAQNSEQNNSSPGTGLTFRDFLGTESLELSRDMSPDKMYAVAAYVKVNWFTAQQICSYQGMTLASISSRRDNENLRRFLLNSGFLNDARTFWVGGSDLAVEGQWIWFGSGRLFNYQNWAPRQPDNAGGNENCLILLPSGKWNDANCAAQRYFICENRCPLSSYEVPIFP